jgi:hypothetical protein
VAALGEEFLKDRITAEDVAGNDHRLYGGDHRVGQVRV